MEKPAYLIDANIMVRFLVDDGNVHSPAVKRLILEARSGKVELRVPFIAITETIFTLQSFYKIDRADIGDELFKLLNAPGMTLTCPPWVLDAVEDYRDKNVSFGDACIAAECRAARVTVASFDKGLSTKFPDVKRYEPRG